MDVEVYVHDNKLIVSIVLESPVNFARDFVLHVLTRLGELKIRID